MNSPYRLIRKHVGVLALFVIVIVLLQTTQPIAHSLDYVWGHMPSNIRIIGIENLNEDDGLSNGEWFQIVYEIKVTKYFYESEDVVRQRVIEHFENFLGRTIREHPEIRIYYAEYRCYKSDGNIFTRNYYYHVKIVGRIEPIELSNGTTERTTRLAAWVPVAIIIALIVAAIIATIVLVQQPAVQRLLIDVGEGIRSVTQNPALTATFLILLITGLMTLVLILVGRKR